MNTPEPGLDTKPKKKLSKKVQLTIIIVAAVIILVTLANNGASGSSPPTSAAPTPAPVLVSASHEATQLGQEAYLRLPNNPDPSQLICLAPDKDVYAEYTTALAAKDYQGILDLSSQGLFCVHNGTEVKVVDNGIGLTKVRVVKSASDVDQDKIGQAGWSASEWVVTQ